MKDTAKKELLMLLPHDDGHSARLRDIAGHACNITWLAENAPKAEMQPAVQKAEIILGDPPPDLLPSARNLRLLQTTWAGVGQYLGALEGNTDCALCNMSGAYGVVIAEHMMAMTLTLCRKLPVYLAAMGQGSWENLGAEKGLEGAVALIVGAGDIGTRFAERLAAFGSKIVGVRRTARPYSDVYSEMITISQLDEWIPKADIIACSIPETEQTIGLLNKARIQAMKDDAILINVGRGSLIDTDALVNALELGRLFGVGLDVTNPEPLPPEHPLWRCPRVLITPHISGIAFGHQRKTSDRIWDISLKNLERYLVGEPLYNKIDPQIGY